MLLGLVPSIGDLCEISPLDYKEIPCEIIDLDHDNYQYRVLFNPKDNKQEIYWISSERINWIARKYKILEATEIDNDLNSKTALIVKATPYSFVYHETDDNVRRLESFTEDLAKAEIFIFDSNSRIAHHILEEPEKQKIFNLTHFKKGNARLKSGSAEVLYHEDY